MVTYQDKVNAGEPKVLTVEKWNELTRSAKVKNICKAIAGLDPNAEDYAERKQALKKRLPVIMPHAAAFTGKKRVSAEAIPSGLAMLDVDHVENPRDFLSQRTKVKGLSEGEMETFFKANGIVLVAITASGQGLRVIGQRSKVERPEGCQTETIEQAQMRMAEALGIQEYDAVTKDLARASYVVPREYILWMVESELFAEREFSELAGIAART